jgi:hypothetical protein
MRGPPEEESGQAIRINAQKALQTTVLQGFFIEKIYSVNR